MRRSVRCVVWLLACALALVLSVSGCTGDTPSVEGGAQSTSEPASDELAGEERAARLIEVAEGELGNTDGARYEDALLEAGGELCYQRGYWCATYVWWSFREAGLAEYLCDGEMTVYPQRQAAYFEWVGAYHESPDEAWQPAPGDIAFFYYSDGFPGGGGGCLTFRNRDLVRPRDGNVRDADGKPRGHAARALDLRR